MMTRVTDPAQVEASFVPHAPVVNFERCPGLPVFDALEGLKGLGRHRRRMLVAVIVATGLGASLGVLGAARALVAGDVDQLRWALLALLTGLGGGAAISFVLEADRERLGRLRTGLMSELVRSRLGHAEGSSPDECDSALAAWLRNRPELSFSSEGGWTRRLYGPLGAFVGLVGRVWLAD